MNPASEFYGANYSLPLEGICYLEVAERRFDPVIVILQNKNCNKVKMNHLFLGFFF